MSTFDVVGIDVSKHTLDVCLILNKKKQQARFDNQKAGWKKMLTWVRRYTSEPWFCMEATGSYSEGVAEFLLAEQQSVSVVNPLQIKSYAKSILSRNKTDPQDAYIIARYAKAADLRIFIARTPEQKALREHTQLLDQLTAQKIQLKSQAQHFADPDARRFVAKQIKQLEISMERLKSKLNALVEEDARCKQAMQLLLSIKGVGAATAYSILAYLPDISNFKCAKQLAAFIGVSPTQKQSGQFVGRTRLSKFGNPRLRKALYMPALVMKQYNEHLKPFIKRLERKGLKPKAIVGAIMRKLAHIIFGVLKHQQPFNPNLC